MQLVADGGKVTEPTAPTRIGYTFNGWYNDDEYSQWNFSGSAVTEPTTLSAQWLNTPTYTVTIPAEVSVGGTATVKAEGVNIAEGSALNVTLSKSDFTLKSAEGAELTYTVTKDGKTVDMNDTVLTVAGGTADNSGTVSLAFALVPGQIEKYSGAYNGTVTFTVAVEEVNVP